MWPILQSWRPGCSRLGSLCCNGLANASDQWLAATGSAIAHDAAASPLHRVVPSARPHGVGTPPRDDWILQGRRGGQPTRVARRPGPLALATRAASIYIAMLTPPASLQAPRRCFSPSAPHGWPSIGALADRRCPATISIYVAIRVEATRSGSYSGYLDLVASLEAWNDRRSAARHHGIIHTAGRYGEAAASLGSACSPVSHGGSGTLEAVSAPSPHPGRSPQCSAGVTQSAMGNGPRPPGPPHR